MRPGVKGVPQLLNVDRQPGKPKKRRKITLVFDEEKRKDFLGGFHKRKLQRRQKAQEELKVKLKEEKKRIKQEARERFKTLVSQRDIPELEELLLKQEYETDGKTVSILELNVNDLAQSSNWIGENKPKYEEECNDEEEVEEAEESEEQNVPGMELKPKKSKNTNENEETKPQLSKKSISKARQKETLKQTSRSKVFQLKQRLDRQRNKKLAKKVQFKQERAIKKAKGKTKRKLIKKKS
ncbi:nucleolar protein 12 [Diachasma alloeum]|uniref:nucleolar protein 12 n=1 Tax=Diachasma alloeum TaxID=454923 RepID=UPI0007382330|nr:nucleolar protein 12 [Diachasma alloeum]